MRFVIVGASTAGNTAAQALREKAPQAEVVLFTNEGYPYYGRPRLTEFLADEVELEHIYFHDEQWYRNNRIDFRKDSPVTRLDPKGRQIFTGGEAHGYDKLLLACGARPVDLPIDGVHNEGVFTLWSVSNAIHMKQFARSQKKVVVLGAGFLGIESARALRKLGLEVTLMDVANRLLPRYLDKEGAQLLKTVVEELGITVLLGEKAESIKGTSSHVEEVRLAGGSALEAGMVLIAAGTVPNKEIAQTAGLVTNRGVIVDKHMRTSSNDIYAAGDVAEFAGRCLGIVPAAIRQARVAVSNMVVEDALAYEDTVPINTLKGLGIDLACIGLTVVDDESRYEVLRLQYPDERIYKKAVLDEGRLAGVILVGSSRNVVPLETIIEKKLDVSSIKDSLLDEGANLHEFVRESEE